MFSVGGGAVCRIIENVIETKCGRCGRRTKHSSHLVTFSEQQKSACRAQQFTDIKYAWTNATFSNGKLTWQGATTCNDLFAFVKAYNWHCTETAQDFKYSVRKNLYMSHTEIYVEKDETCPKAAWISIEITLAYFGWLKLIYLNAIKWHNCKMPESMYRIRKGSQSCQRQSFNILTPLTTQRPHIRTDIVIERLNMQATDRIQFNPKKFRCTNFYFPLEKCENNEELPIGAAHVLRYTIYAVALPFWTLISST